MPDIFDKAQKIEQLQRENALRNRPLARTASRLYCEDCDAPIPEQRRASVQGCTRCIECQTIFETKRKHYKK